MNLRNDFQLKNTKEKLRGLQEAYRECEQRPDPHPYVRQLTLRSLKRLMNQLEEEIARYECGVKARSS